MGVSGLEKGNLSSRKRTSDSENFMGFKVIEFVSFLANRIANKNEFVSSRNEFGAWMNRGGIGKATENGGKRVLSGRECQKGFCC